jgi:hypothetical protein
MPPWSRQCAELFEDPTWVPKVAAIGGLADDGRELGDGGGVEPDSVMSGA